jgi:hypothetical protein
VTIESQLTLLAAVHEQPAVVVTVICVPAPPDAPLDALVGETAYEHDNAVCVIVTT